MSEFNGIRIIGDTTLELKYSYDPIVRRLTLYCDTPDNDADIFYYLAQAQITKPIVFEVPSPFEPYRDAIRIAGSRWHSCVLAYAEKGSKISSNLTLNFTQGVLQ